MLARAREAAVESAASAERVAREAGAAEAAREAAAKDREAAAAEREAADRAAARGGVVGEVLHVEGFPEPIPVTAKEMEGLAYEVMASQETMQDLREEIERLKKEVDVHEARMRAKGMGKCFECQGSGMREYGSCGHCDGDGWVPC